MRDKSTSVPSRTLCVVLPSYNEAIALRKVVPEVADLITSIGYWPHIIVVDDGSSDNTRLTCEELAAQDLSMSYLRLSKNFGHQAALLAGLRLSVGAAVITMDADGQHPSSVITELVKEWENGSTIVQALRLAGHSKRFLKSITSDLFYATYRALSGQALDTGSADFRLMDKSAVDSLLEVAGTRPFLRGDVAWMGFSQSIIYYTAQERLEGVSRYSVRKMFRLALQGLTKYSYRPLHIVAGAGIVAALLSVLVGVYAVASAFISNATAPGWASLLAILGLFAAMNFLMLATMSVYLAQIHESSGTLPQFLVDERLSFGIDTDLAIRDQT